jgi:NDP-sugar pyrophosphorylase family protein
LLVFNGDTLLGFDPHAALRAHAAGGTPATVLVAAVGDRSRFGAIDIDAIGRITQFAEKGRSGPGLVNAGVYVLEADLLRGLPARRPLSLEIDVLPQLPLGALRALVVPGPFLDFGTNEAFDRVLDPLRFLPRPATS